MKNSAIKRKIHINQSARLYPLIRLRRTGNSWALTVPRDSLLTIGDMYEPLICSDGTIVFKSIR